jgi:flagellar operon protein
MSNGSFIYPNVSSLPGQTGISPSERLSKKQEGVPGEFDRFFDKALEKADAPADLTQIKAPLKFSAHASQRLRERKIALDPLTMAKVNDALDKAEAKGVEDTLVLTKDAALIINVKNRTVITAMDRTAMAGNVFTNIDGAVIV